jgi:tetratricopeptide (TPR) repeat protein
MDSGSDDIDSLRDLASAYGKQGRVDEQISVLKKILNIDPNNSSVQSELARVYEDSGEDPLEIFKARFEDNPENASYAVEYSEKLISNGDTDDAIDVLENTLSYNRDNSMVYMSLSKAYNENADFEEAIEILEELFNLDKNNFRVALLISINSIEIDDFESAYEWGQKSMKISRNNAESLAHMGNLYYKSMQTCRGDNFSRSDKIVASLAHEYFVKAENKGNSKYFKQKNWLEENEVLFSYADWFMTDKDIQASGKVFPSGKCYDWVSESLAKQSDW